MRIYVPKCNILSVVDIFEWVIKYKCLLRNVYDNWHHKIGLINTGTKESI